MVGLDGAWYSYLNKDYTGAYVFYIQGMELGYEAAITNVAYLLDHQLVDPWAVLGVAVTSSSAAMSGSGLGELEKTPEADTCLVSSSMMGMETSPVSRPSWLNPLAGSGQGGGEDREKRLEVEEVRWRLALRAHWLGVEISASKDSFIPLGDCYFYGRGGELKGEGGEGKEVEAYRLILGLKGENNSWEALHDVRCPWCRPQSELRSGSLVVLPGISPQPPSR